MLTSHAVWPDWVPYCVYSEQDPRRRPGLDGPDGVWITEPRDPSVAASRSAGACPALPVLDDTDAPGLAAVADEAELARAEFVDRAGTRAVSVAACAAWSALRALSVAACPYVHRDELGGLAWLDRLDLRGMPMRDLAPLCRLPNCGRSRRSTARAASRRSRSTPLRLGVLALAGVGLDLSGVASLPALHTFEATAAAVDLAGLRGPPLLAAITIHGTARRKMS